jgi:GNAT superfamily N-acetyltransferase
MHLIYDKKSLSVNSKSLVDFEKLYTEGFPDKNEREEFGLIKQRIAGEKSAYEPNSIILLALVDSEVAGGLIVDWYAGSGAIHLTYIIVAPTYRKMGLGKTLIVDGIPEIKNWIKEEKGIQIRNVFFESNNPDETTNDNFDPNKRLKIFSKLGAKRIDIPYVQPALDPQRKPVTNLFLLTFPQFNTLSDKILSDDIVAFLEEFYEGLGVTNPSQNNDFQNIISKLNETRDKNNCVPLIDLP